MKEHHKPQDQYAMNNTTAFYMSFGDLMVILCCFFVLIHSVSKVEIGSFERIRTQFTGTSKGSLVELSEDLQKIIKLSKMEDIQVSYDSDGVRLNMETTSLFEVSSAIVKKEALQPLEKILLKVRETPYTLDIEGHTDDQGLYRVRDDLLETNWSLSGLRASSVLHHLIALGFKETRMRIVGYASNRPKIGISGKQGLELSQARAANRRVSILIH
ncbi:MAG: flagellar motor protein MotB [Oligoflexales bacterium]